jgi:hypothetical protein
MLPSGRRNVPRCLRVSDRPAADGSFAFLIEKSPVAHWNGLIGGRLEIGRHFDLLVEAGIGTRSSMLGGCSSRF